MGSVVGVPSPRQRPRPRLRLGPSLAGALVALAAAAPPAGAIVGGNVATRDFPHMAAMEFRQDDGRWTFICGASLVRPDVVLTAAHCVPDDPQTAGREDDPARYRLQIGTRDRGRGGERIGAVRLIAHPEYDAEAGAYDVAVLELERAATLGTPIRIAAREDADRFEPGDEATIIGWGATFSGGPTQRELREGRVPIVSDATCGRNYTVTARFDPPTMICAGNTTGGEDTCQGDSGGPLMVPDSSGRLILVGDVSFGFGCAFPTQFGVYGEVAGATLKPWVDARLEELSPRTESPPPGSGPVAGSPGSDGRSDGSGSDGDGANAPALVRLPSRLGSAARARRSDRLRVLVRPRRAIRGVRLTLRRRGRTVAVGRRASLRNRGRVTLRVRSGLRAGRAVLTLTARDAAGRRVRVVRRVRLSR